MKTHLSVLIPVVCGIALLSSSSTAQEKPKKEAHRVVFEVVSEGREAWDAVLNNVENARKSLGADQTHVVVVAHGKGLGLLLKDSPVRERVENLAGGGVVFAACENTMKKKKVAKEDLLPVATTTDSGVAEVIRKQEDGWSYIKSGG